MSDLQRRCPQQQGLEPGLRGIRARLNAKHARSVPQSSRVFMPCVVRCWRGSQQTKFVEDRRAATETSPTVVKNSFKNPAVRQHRDHRHARRQRQEVLASRSALVSAHLSQLLEVAGWAARSYPLVPDGQERMPGRRWGTSRYAHQRGGPGRLTILLPEQLGEQVRRVAYWVSLPATTQLQQLADETSGSFPLSPLQEMGELAVELYALPLG
jgi:hypothetical protein